YERARAYLVDANEIRNVTLLDTNIAYVARSQGHYRRALDTLHRVLDEAVQFPLEELGAKSDMVECYLYLNRYAEARDMARQVITGYHANKDAHALARALLHLTAAEAGLSNFAAAQAALDEAEPIFASLGAGRWVLTTHLLRGRIALKQGDAAAAYREAIAAAASFESAGQQVDYAAAALLESQALFALGDIKAAAQAASRCLAVAQQNGVPSIRYSTHLLLGQIRQAQERPLRALRHYEAAVATVERVQRGMSITLRPGFLEDKGEALRSLIALHFRAGRAADAFETLERAKSQVLLGYLANRENFAWSTDDSRSRTLMDQLNSLRAEHQWYYRLAHEPSERSDHPGTVPPEQARLEVAARERQMRAITEQLYLRSRDDQQAGRLPTTSLSLIQRSLPEGTLLIEFYNDGMDLWAFTLDGGTIDIRRLPIKVETLDGLLGQLQANIGAALHIDAGSVQTRRLTMLAQRILHRLYSLLIEPLHLQLDGLRRLVVVPYGALHYLPFHLLYDGSAYLIEQVELVTLPAAGLSTRPGPRRQPGALILAHSWDGRLPHTLAEAQVVHRFFGGVLQAEEMACRAALQASPTQILHIAAHGEHRLDQPDLSYLQLADGQVYADDILQQDLSYELVTLSACETGRARVAAGDELIGLGRGFLYSGAGALLVSLWPVVDASTMHFMERTYQALTSGASKAAALRAAQLASLAENRDLHPAFWGAFQLIGDANPLSR
ncbi:MAG: CHAT domain-containing protein, partial [Bacteroidota bacterium]